MCCTVAKKQRLRRLPLLMWSQALVFTLTNQFWNISFWAVMKPFLKYKGGWGGGGGWKEERGGGSRRVLVLIREVKAKEVWPCPLSWNAMWTRRRRLLEPCQGPLTPQRFLWLCPQTQQWVRTCPPPPLRQPRTSPAASPFPASHSFCHSAKHVHYDTVARRTLANGGEN